MCCRCCWRGYGYGCRQPQQDMYQNALSHKVVLLSKGSFDCGDCGGWSTQQPQEHGARGQQYFGTCLYHPLPVGTTRGRGSTSTRHATVQRGPLIQALVVFLRI